MFSIFEDLGISVDVVATSEVSISLTLDPSKLWSRELIQQASEGLSILMLLFFSYFAFYIVLYLIFLSIMSEVLSMTGHKKAFWFSI